MDNWDGVRTAYHVARIGTVSGAAEALGVHHATVIRHIDTLEQHLGVKLFQRHARGYVTTEAGKDLLRVAQETEESFRQMSGRLRGQGGAVSGELVITSLANFTELFVPLIAGFQKQHHDLSVRYITSKRVFRLEYGEAHVAVRAGPPPQEPDNVAQHFFDLELGLFASKDYIAQHGHPQEADNFAGHKFITLEDPNAPAPFARWISENVAPENIRFRGNDLSVIERAMLEGLGLGFFPIERAPQEENLVMIAEPRPEWSSTFWLVTHVDLHRSGKVQAFLKYLKEHAPYGRRK